MAADLPLLHLDRRFLAERFEDGLEVVLGVFGGRDRCAFPRHPLEPEVVFEGGGVFILAVGPRLRGEIDHRPGGEDIQEQDDFAEDRHAAIPKGDSLAAGLPADGG